VNRYPLSTYRIQLNSQFGFDDAAKIVPYLEELGIDYLYSSPLLQAAPGSTHGYDVVDHSKVSRELGGDRAFDRMCDALERSKMGQVLDIVPNHMAIARENPWWWDVLENGPSSAYAEFFDVDWEPPERRIHNTVLMPVLEDQYGILLEAGKLKVVREGGSFEVRNGERVFPVAPRSLWQILAPAAVKCGSDALAFLADGFDALPSPSSTDLKSITRRHRDKKLLVDMLAKLLNEDAVVASAIDEVIVELNADPDRLHEFLEQQNYRVAYWRMAARDLGYRRFFDINSLVGLRIENERVFYATHQLVMRWVAEGRVTGLRVDHPDGLRDPLQYFQRLRAACPDTWIVAEKILLGSEKLRESWPVEGTSGYDFLNIAGRLFVDPAGEQPLTDFYREFTGESADYAALVRARKQFSMRDTLGSEINTLTAMLLDLCEADRLYRDYTRHEAHEVIRATMACLPVYRTYVREPREVAPEDDCQISAAIEASKAYRSDLDARLFDFLRDILTLQTGGKLGAELALRFQQISAAVMAKGVEDTAFYSFNRMLALNEVGGDPDCFHVTTEEFLAWCRKMHRHWPLTMLATSTHDTKRSEDVRARLFFLSEEPERWSHAVVEWAAINERHRSGEMPDRNFEYHLYQSMVGAWPIEKSRMHAYAEKAAREAKVYTSWTDPVAAYEDAVRKFLDGIYEDSKFIESLNQFVGSLIYPGRINSLAQTLLKITSLGVPDFYQGSELWNLALVDPDNRRPQDFDLRRRLLADLRNATPEKVMERMDEGMPKLWLIRQALALRKRHPEWFGPQAGIEPVEVRGERRDHVVAFMRGESVVTIVPRLIAKLGGGWRDTEIELPRGEWMNHMTGERLRGSRIKLADLMRRFPVALLAREGASR
jgi:(1->4)-alpha-D-glucan 1-alpha-D-glucosylmutase